MIRKLFIVAADNTADYQSLQTALAGEPNVTIIYDRRGRSSDSAGNEGDVAREERRRRTDVDNQLRTRGWAVVRTTEPERLDDWNPFRGARTNRLS
jgi:hypothetical protein